MNLEYEFIDCDGSYVGNKIFVVENKFSLRTS